MTKYLLIIVISVILNGRLLAGPSFYDMCMSAKRPQGFDDLIRLEFESKKQKVMFQNKKMCSQLSILAKKADSVGVIYIKLQSLSLLTMFPNLKSINLGLEEPISKIDIGKHEKLKSFTLTAPRVELKDLGDLLYSPHINEITIGTNNRSSSLDIQQFRYFPELETIMLRDIKVKNAKTIEKLPKLEFVAFINVTLDQEIDWSRLPNKVEKRIINKPDPHQTP